MTYRTIIISIFFTINSFNTFPLFKSKPKNGYIINYDHYDHSATKEYFFLQTMIRNEILVNDVAHHILGFNILLKNKNFENHFPYMYVWHDFRIPINYHYLLKTEHIYALEKYFEYTPSISRMQQNTDMHHILSSKEDYQFFLMLPIEIRTYLTKLPLSETARIISTSDFNYDINKHRTVYVERANKYPQERLILPEENKKKRHKNINMLYINKLIKKGSSL